MTLEKKYKITFSPGNYGEIVDSISDLFEAGIAIGKALDDGFQVEDLLVLINEYPNLKEVVNDLPVFAEQFTQLAGADAIAAVQQAKQRVEESLGGEEMPKVAKFIFAVLANLANGYNFAILTYEEAVRQLDAWKALKDIIKPPEDLTLADPA